MPVTPAQTGRSHLDDHAAVGRIRLRHIGHLDRAAELPHQHRAHGGAR
jgi:hypothetical protein